MAHSLLYDNLSAEDFESTWSACSSYRAHQIINECQNIGDILKAWPQYKQPNGFKLIDKDFSFLHAFHDPLLTWGYEKLVRLFHGLQVLKATKSVEINQFIDSINVAGAEKDVDTFALKVLWSVHYFLNPTGKFVRKNVLGKKEMSRFTTKDSQESFLFIGNTLQELQDHIEFLKRREQNIQPFLLAIGNFENIQQFFVYLDGNLLPFSNFRRALDICFKVFHIFHLEYPKPSETFWLFIEAYFYALNSSVKNSKVSIFLDSLK